MSFQYHRDLKNIEDTKKRKKFSLGKDGLQITFFPGCLDQIWQ